jgi:MFS superfamily sulfate permease-like transporter
MELGAETCQSLAHLLAWASVLLPAAVLVVHFFAPGRLPRLPAALLFITAGPVIGLLVLRLEVHVSRLLEAMPESPAREHAGRQIISVSCNMVAAHLSGALQLVLLLIYGLAAAVRWLIRARLAPYQDTVKES